MCEKFLKESMKPKWNFLRGGVWGISQKTFHRRGMGIFWNNTTELSVNIKNTFIV